MSQTTSRPPGPRGASPARPAAGGSVASRRKHERVPVAVAAEIAFADDDRLPARTHDLSAGGVRLVVGREVKDGTTLALSLHLTEDGIEKPDVPPVTLDAVAVWSAEVEADQWVVGCRFASVPPAARAQLEAYLAAVSASAGV